MELLQLRYFQEVARTQHMTKAAQNLNISQPSLSKTIRLLEQEVGAPLFDRAGKYIRLNASGEAFLRHSARALQALEDGCSEVAAMTEQGRHHIRLAFLAGSPLVPDLISGFRNRFPQAQFHLLSRVSMKDGPAADIWISNYPETREGMASVPLLKEDIFLAVPAGHRLAECQTLTLEEAAGEDFISLKQGNSLRDLTDLFCLGAGFQPKVIFESDDPGTVRGMIRAGLGVGFIPAVSWGGTTGDAVRLLKIIRPDCTRTIGMFWQEDRFRSPLVTEFMAFAGEYYRSLG